MFPANLDIRMTAMLNKNGNIIPIAESSFTSFVEFRVSMRYTVITPVIDAPIIKKGEFRSWTIKNAITIPRSIVWVMASDIIAMLFKTRKTPNNAQALETTTAVSSISIFISKSFPSPVFKFFSFIPQQIFGENYSSDRRK